MYFFLEKIPYKQNRELAWHSSKTCYKTETSCFLKSQATFVFFDRSKST